MPDYRRAHVPGGTYFFTVNTYPRQTFLPDVDMRSAHLHALWTLPPGDKDFSYRWRVTKRMVTQRCRIRLNRPKGMNGRRRKRNQSTLWRIDSGNIKPTSTGISITSIGTR